MNLLNVFYALTAIGIVCSGLATFGFFNEVQVFGVPALVIVAVVVCVVDYFVMMNFMRGGKQRRKKEEKK